LGRFHTDILLTHMKQSELPFGNITVVFKRNFCQVRTIGKSLIDEVNENSVESSFYRRNLDVFRGCQHNSF
jgi:hypothetical protein